MAENSKIEWTDATWNPWQGCTKVSPACTNCYMFTDMKRYGKDGAVVHRSARPTFSLPLRRKRGGEYKIASGSKVFTCSWSDWFHEKADEWRDEAWAIIRQRPDLTFQIVTKRTERIAQCLPADWCNGYENVWLIATVENQEWADRRIPELLSVPAVVRGLSIEPLLGPLDLRPALWLEDDYFRFRGAARPDWQDRHIHWVIVGGESGPKARALPPQWVRTLRDQCRAASVSFFFKQWGEWSSEVVPGTSPNLDNLAPNQQVGWGDGKTNHTRYTKVGKAAAGRLLDGSEWNEFPALAATA